MFVVVELELALAHPPAEGEPHPERVPVGPFETQEEAANWAREKMLFMDRSGLGSFTVAPLVSPW